MGTTTDTAEQDEAPDRLLTVPRTASALAVAAGIVVACGWAFDIPVLRSLAPGLPEMKLNAAVAFALAGASLWLLQQQDGSGRIWSARVCAAAVVLVGALTLAQYAFGWNLGIDELLAADRTGDSPHPGRIPVAGAFNFVLLGTALLLLDVPRPAQRSLAQWPALIVALVAFVVILGFAYDVSSLYRPRASSAVALHGMILFALLAIGTLLARSDRGLVADVLAADAGGLLLRRLLPAAILIPPVLGWLRTQGEHAGLYQTDLGIALFATANVVIFSVLIWNTAAVVRRADEQARAAEFKLRAQFAKLDLLNHITHAIGERQDLSSIFQVVVRSLEAQMPVDFACVGLYEPVGRTLSIESVGAHSERVAREIALAKDTRIVVEGNGLSRALLGTLIYEPDIQGAPFSFPQRLANGELRALVMAPLRAESSVFGLLIVARRDPASFSSADCEFLRQLSEHVALATRQAQLHSALQRAYEDLRQSQHTIVQQERLRALGQMASGIAHDINNALSPLSLYAESLLEQEAQLSARGREQLNIVQRGIDDVTQTVARLREFYRPRDAQLQLMPVELNQLVPHVVDLTRSRWRDTPQQRGTVIELRTELEPSLPKIMGSEAEIRDALTNLIFNAVDAMPSGGALTILTRTLGRSELEGERASIAQVCIEVIDTGLGMDAETRQRCLEPFFTTKGERGTGMGLAMVYGMAQRHGAEFEIDSTVGAGTTVRITFPVAGADTTEHSLQGPAVPLHNLRILVVDDDPLVLRSLRDSLEADGHIVTTADGGQLGIDTFVAALARHEPFAAVITDLGMPYVDGRKVAAGVRAALPAVPVILLTGWGERLLREQDVPPGVDRVLAKPPKLRELRAALGELTNPDVRTV